MKLPFSSRIPGKYNTWILTLYLNRYIDFSMTLFRFSWCLTILRTIVMDFVLNKHILNGVIWYFLEYSVNLPVINIHLYIIHIQVMSIDSTNTTPGTGNHKQHSVKFHIDISSTEVTIKEILKLSVSMKFIPKSVNKCSIPYRRRTEC